MGYLIINNSIILLLRKMGMGINNFSLIVLLLNLILLKINSSKIVIVVLIKIII